MHAVADAGLKGARKVGVERFRSLNLFAVDRMHPNFLLQPCQSSLSTKSGFDGSNLYGHVYCSYISARKTRPMQHEAGLSA
jgi:hypothetical protein